MLSNSFPSKSIHAFETSKSNWKDYVARLDALLDSVVASKSFDLVKISVRILKEKKHVHLETINAKLDLLFADLVHPFSRGQCSNFLTLAVLSPSYPLPPRTAIVGGSVLLLFSRGRRQHPLYTASRKESLCS